MKLAQHTRKAGQFLFLVFYRLFHFLAFSPNLVAISEY